MTREASIERYLVAQVKKRGGEVRKVQWVGHRGAPDRVIMLPFNWLGTNTVWVELKATGVKPEPHQLREHARMLKAGQVVLVIDSFERVDQLLQ